MQEITTYQTPKNNLKICNQKIKTRYKLILSSVKKLWTN